MNKSKIVTGFNNKQSRLHLSDEETERLIVNSLTMTGMVGQQSKLGQMNLNEKIVVQAYALYCIIDALKEVGIEIEPKKNVIDEIKEKWENLNKEQQQAVAIAFTKAVL